MQEIIRFRSFYISVNSINSIVVFEHYYYTLNVDLILYILRDVNGNELCVCVCSSSSMTHFQTFESSRPWNICLARRTTDGGPINEPTLVGIVMFIYYFISSIGSWSSHVCKRRQESVEGKKSIPTRQYLHVLRQ